MPEINVHSQHCRMNTRSMSTQAEPIPDVFITAAVGITAVGGGNSQMRQLTMQMITS